MKRDESTFHPVCILEEEGNLTLGELCRACAVHAEFIFEMVDEGVLEPKGSETTQWRFSGACIHQVNVVLRLQRDLGVNLAGAAMVLDLMDEIARLRAQLNRFK